MITRQQIIKFLKQRNNNDKLNNIISVITLSMVKFYDDKSIINFVDNIIIKESKRVKTILIKDDNIVINANLNIISKIEYLTEVINYKYINGNYNLEGINKVINILQVEDIIKVLFKMVKLYDIDYLKELNKINIRDYKCYINQVETNLIRPLYKFYKKINKNNVKKNILNNIDLKDINTLYDSINGSTDILEVSETYRKIKDIIREIIKEV